MLVNFLAKINKILYAIHLRKTHHHCHVARCSYYYLEMIRLCESWAWYFDICRMQCEPLWAWIVPVGWLSERIHKRILRCEYTIYILNLFGITVSHNVFDYANSIRGMKIYGTLIFRIKTKANGTLCLYKLIFKILVLFSK